MSSYALQEANSSQIAEIHALIREHGPNPWNFIPEAKVGAHLAAMAVGRTRAVIAKNGSEGLVALVTFEPSDDYHRYQPTGSEIDWQGHIGEVVVHREHRGHGLGALLLREAVARLQAWGLPMVYAERHEENEGSAGMMRKAGFVELDTFDDPARRSSGSRRTTVCRYAGEPLVPDPAVRRAPDGAVGAGR